MPMGRYSASSSVNSDLAAAAVGGDPRSRNGTTSKVTASASSSRVVSLGSSSGGSAGNGEVGTPTGTAPTQAIGNKVGEGFSTLRHFTSSVVKSFSLSAGLFQAATEEKSGSGSGAASASTPSTSSSTVTRHPAGASGVVTGPGASSSSSAVSHHPLPRQPSNVVSHFLLHDKFHICLSCHSIETFQS